MLYPRAHRLGDMSIADKLARLGIELPEVTAPLGAYTAARVAAGLVYTSGQLPLLNGALSATGKVGAAVDLETAQVAARVCALNALAAAAAAVDGVDKLTGVVKVTVFVAATPAFTEHPAVANGASELFIQVFGESGRHVRAAVGVASLPKDAPVEVEVVFALD